MRELNARTSQCTRIIENRRTPRDDNRNRKRLLHNIGQVV